MRFTVPPHTAEADKVSCYSVFKDLTRTGVNAPYSQKAVGVSTPADAGPTLGENVADPDDSALPYLQQKRGAAPVPAPARISVDPVT